MPEQEQDQQSLSNGYAEAWGLLEQDLADLGIGPKAVLTPQPDFPENASAMSDDQLKETYDRYLQFYDYLTDQLTSREIGLGFAAGNLKAIEADLAVAVAAENPKMSVDMRAAHVVRHPYYLQANQQHCTVVGSVKAFQAKMHSCSKIMDRLYRELLLRSESNKQYGRSQSPVFQPSVPNTPGPARRPWDAR